MRIFPIRMVRSPNAQALLALFMCAGALFVSMALHAAEKSILPFFWSDATDGRDMPWIGTAAGNSKAGRLRWFRKDVSGPLDFDSRGPKIETRWGLDGRSGHSPYDDGEKIVAFLRSTGYLKSWPAYLPTTDAPGDIAYPYRLTLVAIEPMIVLMRFDLSAAIEDPIPFSFGAFPVALRDQSYKQQLGSFGLRNRIMFGTKVRGGGNLYWFSPDANITPQLLETAAAPELDIAAPGIRLKLVKVGEDWEVRMP